MNAWQNHSPNPDRDLEQSMPFNRFVFYFALAGLLVGGICAALIRWWPK